jgi:OOP family OmpA-OmpF porin
MKSFPVLRLLTLAGLTPLLAAPALAQDSYYYGGIGAGQSRGHLDAAAITAGQAAPVPPVTVTGTSTDTKDNAYKVFLGYQFNRNVGVELGYFHLGEFRLQSTTTAGGLPGGLDGRVRSQGANLDLVGTLPFTDNFAGLARVGAQLSRTRDTFTGSGSFAPTTPSPSGREVNAKVGVGLQYAFSPAVLVRTEVERYRIDDAVGHHPNVNFYSLSLVLPFGRSAAPAPRPVAQAAPTYAAPTYAEPAPAVLVAPLPESASVAAFAPPAPPPAPRRVSYAAESVFGFDRAVLTPEGKAALDAFAQELQGTTFDRITVEGYTDRLGTEDYNLKLSLQRAEVVKTYLAANGGVDAQKIEAVGKGEAAPVTQPGDCIGAAATAKLVTCLQPDRRVEIEVAGTR